MKETFVKDFKVISNNNSTNFEREVKEFLSTHQAEKNLISSYAPTSHGFVAFFEWETVKLEPENIKDEFILRGEKYTCSNCPMWGGNTPQEPNEPRRAFTCTREVYPSRRGCETACLWLYQEIAKGEIKPI